MWLSKINLLNSILFALFLLAALAPNATAETTFFDQDDAFIMGSPATGGAIGGTTVEESVGGGCLYKWNCTNWDECTPSGKQARNCANIGACPSAYKSPETEQNCTYNAPPKAEKEDKWPEDETGKQNETGKASEKEIANNYRLFICLILALMISFIIFYLEKYRFKDPIKTN
jgi:hypothetical protein